MILLKEAEAVLKPDGVDLRKFDVLRKRYLLLILSDVMRWYEEGCAAIPQAPRTDGEVDLHCLASAMVSREVLEDFLEMIQVTRDEKGRVDSGALRAFHMYEEARLNDILDTGYGNLQHSLQEAFRLYRQETSSAEDGQEVDLDGQAPVAGEDLRLIIKMYTSAPGYHRLVSFRQDMAAIYISRIFNSVKSVVQEEVDEGGRAKRRKGARGTRPDKSGPKVSGLTYHELLHSQIAEDGKALKSLRSIQSHGSHLLHYEAACGREHPLWIMRPTRTLQCLIHESCRVQHVE